MALKEFDSQFVFDTLKSCASFPRRRTHHNLHKSHLDAVQKLFVIMVHGTYIRPHRHSISAAEELLVALKGEFALITFFDDGSIISATRFAPLLEGERFYVSIPPMVWHTIICLSEDGVLFEVKEGPFVAEKAKEFAPWAPHATGD